MNFCRVVLETNRRQSRR